MYSTKELSLGLVTEGQDLRSLGVAETRTTKLKNEERITSEMSNNLGLDNFVLPVGAIDCTLPKLKGDLILI